MKSAPCNNNVGFVLLFYQTVGIFTTTSHKNKEFEMGKDFILKLQTSLQTKDCSILVDKTFF